MDKEHLAYQDLIAYATGELNPEQAALTGRHLAGCTECAATVRRFQATAKLLRELRFESPSPAVIAQTQARFAHPLYQDLLAYGAGDLDAAKAAYTAEHIGVCKECAATVARVRAARSTWSTVDFKSPSSSAVAKAYALYAPRRRARGTAWLPLLRLQFKLPQFSLAPSRLSVARALIVLVLTVGFILGGGGVMVAAAQTALPGDALYPIKTTDESLQLALSPDAGNKTALYLAFSQNRIKEIQALVAQQRFAQVPQTAEAFETDINQAIQQLAATGHENAARAATLAPQLAQALDQDTHVLMTVQGSLPEALKRNLEPTITFSQKSKTFIEQQPAFTTPATVPASLTATSTLTLLPTQLATATLQATETKEPTRNPAATQPADETNTPRATGIPQQTDTPGATTAPNVTNTPQPSETVPPPTSTPKPTNTAKPSVTVLPPTNTRQPQATNTPKPTNPPKATHTPKPTNPPKPTNTPKPTHTPKPHLLSDDASTPSPDARGHAAGSGNIRYMAQSTNPPWPDFSALSNVAQQMQRLFALLNTARDVFFGLLNRSTG